MGEQENKEDGEKKEEAKKEGEENKADEKKDEEAAEEIVLKVDMHCEACARKVARALKGFQGVENVTADCKASKVVVKGKTADPLKVCQRIQKKSGRKVELVSPLPKPPEETKEEVKQQPPPAAAVEEKKKEEPPVVITVVLNVQMHCDACAQVLQKRIRKLKGVESVATDLASNKVTVKGIVDPEKLVSDVYKRTGKQASIVKDEEKKEEEKKDEANDKKEEIKADQEKKESSEEGDDDKKRGSSSDHIKRSEYWPQRQYLYRVNLCGHNMSDASTLTLNISFAHSLLQQFGKLLRLQYLKIEIIKTSEHSFLDASSFIDKAYFIS